MWNHCRADEPSDGKSSEESESEEEAELEGDELGELQAVVMATMVNEEDNKESVEDIEDHYQDERDEHCGIIGTIALELTGGEHEPSEFSIRYPKLSCQDWTPINTECLLLPTDDFQPGGLLETSIRPHLAENPWGVVLR